MSEKTAPPLVVDPNEIRIGVFNCACGINIAGVIDMDALVEFSKTLPNVKVADKNISLCTTAGADFIKKFIKEQALNRIVVAACTPKTHEPVFQAVLVDCGLEPSYLEFVNIREHSSFVHQADPKKALEVAKDQIRGGVARAARLELVPERVVPVTDAALVIGGGVAGLQSALDLANQGHKVYLVEQNPTIGGKMSMMDRTFPTDDCSI
jgi:heterodisulfide reductase subunit A